MMKTTRTLILPLLFSLSLSGCSTVSDWFAGEDNTDPAAELKPLTGSLTARTLWSASAGGGSEDEFYRLLPGVDDNRIYACGREGQVSAFSSSGARQWSVDLDLPLSGGVGVGEGLVLVGSEMGDLIALDASSGAERWRVQVSSGVLSAPVASKGRVIVRTIDGNLAGLDAESGEQVWVYPRRVPALTLRGVSSPVVVGKAALSGSDSGKLTMVSLATGRPLWEKNIASPQGRTELERMVDIDGDPVVFGNRVYVVSFQGRVAALNLDNGHALWAKKMSSSVGLDADRDQVYVTDHESHVWALDASTGESLWQQDELHRRQLTRPVVAGRYVVVADFEGYVHWLSKEDGRIVARTQVDADGILSSPVTKGETVYVLSRGGTLAALTAGI